MNTVFMAKRLTAVSLFNASRVKQFLTSRMVQTKPRMQQVPSNMLAWQIHERGAELRQTNSARVPIVSVPDHVLVEVHAASVNPFDVMMIGGYGSSTLNLWRRVNGTLKNGSEFPMTPGRDFSGHIVEVGCGVDHQKFKVGDAVYGAGDVALPGTHAQYVCVSSKEIAHKPTTLDHIEAASLPYVAATSWAAMCTISGYSRRTIANKRVLIFGGSGGVGTFVIQLLKAWGAHITTTCSSDAVQKVLELGADIALDYTLSDVHQELRKLPGFDFIFDAVGGETTNFAPSLLLPFTGATYVRVVVPFLSNNDEFGLACGLTNSSLQYGSELLKGMQNGVHIRWGLFMPSAVAMETVAKLVDEGKIVPQVECVFPFSQLPAAYSKVAEKHNRGKTVVDVIGSRTSSS